jgi:hypothetical protein
VPLVTHKIKARTPEEKARRAVKKFKSRRMRATYAILKNNATDGKSEKVRTKKG